MDLPVRRRWGSFGERFWTKVQRDGLNNCWEWQAYRSADGYGIFQWHRTKAEKAHRTAWILTHGAIPEGLVVDHLCRNRGCVNPRHMELVTSVENTKRGREVTTECPHGHEYTPDNVLYTSQGYRYCRTCKNERVRRKYHEAKALALAS